MAKIILGAQGIWVDANIVPETGTPGNQETRLKTILDVTRAGLWALISHVYRPSCQTLIHLSEVDLKNWNLQEVSCEHQGQVDLEP